MFIPIWLIHVIATLVFIGFLLGWAFRGEGQYDFTPILKIPVCLIGYLVYWLIMK
jgi:hypothetical protein